MKWLGLLSLLVLAACSAEEPEEASSVDPFQAEVCTMTTDDGREVTALGGIVFDRVKLSGEKAALWWSLKVGEETYEQFDVSRRQGGMVLRPVGAEHIAIHLQIAPAGRTLAGRELTGLRLQYRLEGQAEGSAWLSEHSCWALGGTAEDAEWFLWNVYGPREYSPSRDDPFDTRHKGLLHSRFGKMSAFDYQIVAGRGELAVIFERPGLVSNGVYVPDRGQAPWTVDRYLLSQHEPLSPEKLLLWRIGPVPADRVGRVNHYLPLRLDVEEGYRSAVGLEPGRIAPLLNTGPRMDHIKPKLAAIAQAGFRRINLGPIWASSATEGGQRTSMSTYDFTVAEQWGGLEGLRTFCTAAHEQGLEVFAWLPFVHLSDESPLLAEHPDWRGHSIRNDLFDKVLIPLNLNHPEVRRHLLDSLKTVRQAGLDGLWLDSYHNFAIEVVTPRGKELVSQFDAVMEVQREMQAMGYTLYAEAWTPLAVTSCGGGGGRDRFYRDHPYRGLEMAPWIMVKGNAPGLDAVDYFAFLGWGGAPLLNSHVWSGKTPLWNFTPEQIQAATRYHAMWNAVQQDMVGVPVLLEDGRSVQWTGPDGAIVWNLTRRTSRQRAVDVLAPDEPIETNAAGHSILAPRRVYRIPPPTP